MFNLLISFGISAVVTVLFGYIFGAPRIVIGYGIIPGVIVFVAAMVYLGRRTNRSLTAIMDKVQTELQPKNLVKPDPKRYLKGIDILEEGYAYQHWQFLVKSQIDGQIGMLYFLGKEFDKATPYLESTSARNWVAKAMLGVIKFKRKKYDEMRTIFENAVKKTKKESLLWNLYAYCVWKSGKRNDAIDILSRGGEILNEDERIQSNRLALQKNKKMKMRGWKEMWYQFHLDTPPQPKMQMDRRSIYRGR